MEKKLKIIEPLDYQHFPIPEYWNWGWYKRYHKQKENVVSMFKTFFKKL